MIGAYLFGPFVGELSWELYRFAPYAIHLKKTKPKKKLVVFTRPERFDLYGRYADIFVPLNLKNNEGQDCFGVRSVSLESYETLARVLYEKYKDKFSITSQIYPNIDGVFRKIKWQFPRSRMDYDFKPREKNVEIINELVGERKDYLFVDSCCEYGGDSLNFSEIRDEINSRVDNIYSTEIGCVIELISRASAVIGNLQSPYSHLTLLLKKPLITVNEELSLDSISLLNPFNTLVIKCDETEEGVCEFYENNI